MVLVVVGDYYIECKPTKHCDGAAEAVRKWRATIGGVLLCVLLVLVGRNYDSYGGLVRQDSP